MAKKPLVSTQQIVAEGMRDAAQENTALNRVVYGNTTFSRDQMPCAMMQYLTGVPFNYANQKQDVTLLQSWIVYGRDPDEVSVIFEQLMFLFYEEAVRSTLQTLGFIKYEFTNQVAPTLIDGGDLAGRLNGVINFNVRMTIRNPF